MQRLKHGLEFCMFAASSAQRAVQREKERERVVYSVHGIMRKFTRCTVAEVPPPLGPAWSSQALSSHLLV